MSKKLLIISVAGWGYDYLQQSACRQVDGLEIRKAAPVLPAVTCTAQASFRTASPPSRHGMISNGLFCRSLARPMFWEQSSRLVGGERIWDGFRRKGGRVGLLFWQQSMGEQVDLLLTPAPIHKHHGGMIQDCYGQPDGLYQRLCESICSPFKLQQYWGPLASVKAGDWITAATGEVLRDKELAPDLLLTYLPTLDYDLQRHGLTHERSKKALEVLTGQLRQLVEIAGRRNYEVLIFGDYAIEPTAAPAAVFPNRALLEAGWLKVRQVGKHWLADLHTSRAFAMVDHQVAHVYLRDGADGAEARNRLAALDGVAEVLDRQQQAALGLDHAASGDLVLFAQAGKWLAYPWWTHHRNAPEYAGHVDIHNKPGYDPCELFFGWLPPATSQNAGRIKGTHGRGGPGKEIAYATTLPLLQAPATLIELAETVRTWLDSENL